MMRRIVLLARVAIPAVAAFVLASCFHTHEPAIPVPVPPPPPVANSPANAVRRFAWCWVNRNASVYAGLFTADFRFIFAPNDSAGIAYRVQPWTREDELSCAQYLFVGGGDRPAASAIALAMDNNLVALADPRPGMTYAVHRVIDALVDLRITITDANGTPDVLPVSGHALFYLVRGDSASIPTDLVAQGYRPDSTRWWIERWEDNTSGANDPAVIAASRFATQPTQNPSWGRIKALYLSSVPTLASGRAPR